MISEEIAKEVLGKLNTLGFQKSDKPSSYSMANSFKKSLVSSIVDIDVKVINSSRLEIVMPKSDYLNAILTDFYFGKVRVENQIKHLTEQVNGDLQAAWCVVTTYYACYFMCNDISKIAGKFITNLTAEDQNRILSNAPPGKPSSFHLDGPSSFAVVASQGSNLNEIKLDMIKTGARPHQVTWTNVSSLINSIKIFDKRSTACKLLKDIVSSSNNRWSLPSEIRNEWNYSAPNLYGDSGTEIGKVFLSLMKQGSSGKWASQIGIQPHENNRVAALAYVYDCLNRTYQLVDDRLSR
jgi:hypothetical protein